MLLNIHPALRQFIYSASRIDPQEVEICFDEPAKSWVESLTRPTVNLFLYGIHENKEKRESNMQTLRGSRGAERRMPPRRIDLCYMVSVLTTDIEDEHELLWRLLATLMKYPELPRETLPDSLKHVEPAISTRLGEVEESALVLDLWSALGTPPHPTLSYIVTAPLDLEIAFEVPLVLTRTARYVHGGKDVAVIETGTQIGGVVRNKNTQPLADVTVRLENSACQGGATNEQGQFVLHSVPRGNVTLNVVCRGKVQKQVQVTVPSDNYDILLDD
jgi:hypothetical protein